MTTERGVISFPVPPYSNPPIEPQFFEPSRFVISAISLGVTTTVTATENMNYVIGQLVRLIIPANYGSYQLNETQGYVLSLPASDEVELSIDSSRNVDAFINASNQQVQAQILAIGDINKGTINPNGRSNTGTFIPGSFINVSP